MTHKLSLDRSDFTVKLNQAADLLEAPAKRALKSLLEKSCEGREWTGWVDWPAIRGFSLADEILNWKKNLSFSYDTVVVIGIGGSYLGSKAVVDIMSSQFQQKVVFAGQNMSETAMADLLDFLENKSPILTVISKSGTTTEPAVAFRVLSDWMLKRFGAPEASKRIIAITDPEKGALKKLSQDKNYKRFEVPADVGGRYSVFTSVGLVPLALAGFDIKELLTGAHEVFSSVLGRTSPELCKVALEYAQCRNAAWNQGKLIDVVTYPEPRMRNLVEWYKQLFGESDGKQGRGLFPASIECTMDLHSMGQYLQEGARTMIETFITASMPRRTSERVLVPKTGSDIDELLYLEGRGIDEVNHQAVRATKAAHTDGEVPCLELRLDSLSLGTVGALFAMLETSCAIGGIMLGINPFNQPGVEAYKLNMFKLLGKP